MLVLVVRVAFAMLVALLWTPVKPRSPATLRFF